MKKVLLSSVLLTSILTASSVVDAPVAQAEESKSSFLDRFHSKNDMRLRYKSIEAGSFFFNTIDASKSSTDVEADYERVQLDAIIKF